jgi:hypothetical protein
MDYRLIGNYKGIGLNISVELTGNNLRVYRKSPASLIFMRPAAHFHVRCIERQFNGKKKEKDSFLD